jgi:hypothetical protein
LSSFDLYTCKYFGVVSIKKRKKKTTFNKFKIRQWLNRG